MSKRRVPTNKVSSSGVKGSRSTLKSSKKTTAKSKTQKSADDNLIFGRSIKRHHFAGVALGGAKSDRTCVAFLEYYPEQKKIFLSEIVDKIKNEGELSSDEILVQHLTKARYEVELIGINAPLTLPVATASILKCPGAQAAVQEEMEWMWDHYRKQVAKRKNHKLFTPYTERATEQYISTELEEPFSPGQALGANSAPLWARANYLLNEIKVPAVEVFPKLSLWRIGRALLLQRSYLRFHKHQIDGENARLAIVKELVRREIAFLYEQDVRMLVENVHAFDAFLCAITAMLQFQGQCEKKPKDFPSGGGWIEIPKTDIIW